MSSNKTIDSMSDEWVRRMELILFWILHISTLIIITTAITSNIYAPFHVISLKDITPDERRQIAYFEKSLERSKRSGGGSGSGDILNILKTAVGNGIKKKIGQIASASAAASGAFSRTSSSGGGKEYYHHPEYHQPDYQHVYHDHHEHSNFDYLDLKKSILNTLLQAVKAIKGGVLAVKGQLIKGGGKLISASGHLVSSGGQSITELGKTIATKAILVPYQGSSGHHYKNGHHQDHIDGAVHYTAPSAPEDIYHHAPSGPSTDYHVPDNYPPRHREDAAGLLVLKKIPSTHYGGPTHSINSRQSFSPSVTSMIGKFLSASSSWNPDSPELYKDYPRAQESVNSYQAYMVPATEVVPSVSGLVTQETPVDGNSNNYGLPFEKSPDYLNENLENLIPLPSNNHNYKISQNSVQNSAGYKNNEGYETKPVINSFKSSTNSKPNILVEVPYSSEISNESFYPDDKNPSESENSLSHTLTESSEHIYKTPSLYLETPRKDSFLPTPANTLNYNDKTPESSNIDIFPSITYEISPRGTKKLM